MLRGEVGGQAVGVCGAADLAGRHEPSSVELRCGVGTAGIGATVDIDQFAFDGAFVDVGVEVAEPEVRQPEFLGGFTGEGFMWRLAHADVSADGRVPLAWLDVFPHGAPLQIELAVEVKDVQMDHRVEQAAAVVAVPARSLSDDVPCGVYQGEHLGAVVVWRVVVRTAVTGGAPRARSASLSDRSDSRHGRCGCRSYRSDCFQEV